MSLITGLVLTGKKEKQQFLIVYVDGMKLAGPAHLMAEAWAKLGEGIGLEKTKGNVVSGKIKEDDVPRM